MGIRMSRDTSCYIRHHGTRWLYYEIKEMEEDDLKRHNGEACNMQVCTNCGETTQTCSIDVCPSLDLEYLEDRMNYLANEIERHNNNVEFGLRQTNAQIKKTEKYNNSWASIRTKYW